MSSLSVLRDIPWSVAAMGLGCDCRGGFCSCRLPAATRMARAEYRWLRFLKRQRQQRQRWLDAKRSDEPFSTCVCISGCNCPRTPLAKRRRLCDDPRSCFDMRCLCHLWLRHILLNAASYFVERCYRPQNSCKCFLLRQEANYFVDHCSTTTVDHRTSLTIAQK